MTDERMRIAVAEAQGWKWYRRPADGIWSKKPMRSLYHPLLVPEYVATLQLADMSERECNASFIWREGMVPDYLNDWNPVHDAVNSLTPDERRQWLIEMELIIGWTIDQYWDEGRVFADYLIDATRHQWCEAYLRVKGKWEDV